MRIKGAKYFVEPGQKFGRLTVIQEITIRDNRGYKQRRVICKCDCGNEITTNLQSIFKHTSSCGCFRKENSANMLRTHGLENDPVYAIFKRMRARCCYVKNQDYPKWGGRGITICNEWFLNPKLFVDWANNHGYQKGLTIERIDNNKGYSPDNCIFTNRLRQANNTRNNHIIEYGGEKMSMADFCRTHNLNYARFYQRLKAGLSIDKSMQNCGYYIPINETDKLTYKYIA
jgi:hypothetical protein